MEYCRLEDLALEGVGRSVSQVLKRLFDFSAETDTMTFEDHYLNPVCKSWEKLISKNVPPSLANEVTEINERFILQTLRNEMQIRFEHMYYSEWSNKVHEGLYGAESYDCYSDFVDMFTHIAARLACAVTHPFTTVLKHTTDDRINFPFIRLYYRDVVSKIQSLKELIAPNVHLFLTVAPQAVTASYYLNENLSCIDTFDFNAFIRNKFGGNLKMLSCTFKDFLRFQPLDHYKNLTHLEVKPPFPFSIQESSEVPLIQESKSLTSLSMPTVFLTVPLFPECFPNLRCLKLTLSDSWVSNIDMTILKDLKQLTSLSVACGEFGSIRNLLREIGSQLVMMQLDMERVDVKFIATHCINMKSLGFSFILPIPQENHEIEALQHILPKQYQSVETLNLTVTCEKIWKLFPYISSCFVNAKELQIRTVPFLDDVGVSLDKCLLMPLKTGHFRVIGLNMNRIVVSGNHAVITNDDGYLLTVPWEDLERVAKELCGTSRKKIQHLGRYVRVISTNKFK